jgi:hypothetical protein
MNSAGESLDDGIVPRVGQVLQQVVEGALAGHVVLDQETQEREHRQPPCSNTTGQVTTLISEKLGKWPYVWPSQAVYATHR